MAGFKLPDFNDRRAASQSARASALEKIKARPPVDPEEQARRRAEREAREAAKMEERRAAKEAKLQAEEAARAAQERAEEEAREEAARLKKEAKAASKLSEEEAKARRDAKYAARKNKKKR